MRAPDSVRPALPSDAAAIAAVQRRGWSARDPRMARLADEAGLDEAAVAAAWGTAAALAASGGAPLARVVVAIDGSGAVAGFAATAAGDDGSAELLELVVDPGLERRGHGSRLLAAVADLARAAGAGSLTAWVPADGAGTGRAFLASAGLVPDGASRELEAPDGTRATQVRLAAELTADPAGGGNDGAR